MGAIDFISKKLLKIIISKFNLLLFTETKLNVTLSTTLESSE